MKYRLINRLALLLLLVPLALPVWAQEATQKDESPKVQAEAGEAPLYTNDDLPALPGSGSEALPALPRAWGPPSSRDIPAPPVSSETETAILTLDNYRDYDGHGEAWWRARVADLETRLTRADERVDRAYRELRQLLAFRQAMRLPDRRYGWMLDDARQELEDAMAARSAIIEERSDLTEEARRAGALPGWLRPKPGGRI